MKQNRYDDPAFFNQYAQMSRSQLGLDGAGEWTTLQRLLPAFTNKRVLDLGCGYGWHCAYAAQNGAKSILGIDISEKMLSIARQKHAFPNITYQCMAMEDLSLPNNSVDIVLSSLALHYVRDYAALVQRISQWLTPGGHFVFSVEHPVFTAQGPQDWTYDDSGTISHFPVDNYYYEGPRDAVFLGHHIIKYHRTLTTYLTTLTDNGLTLRSVTEPQPPQHLMHIPGMKDEMRRPMMLIIAAQKP